uniref:coiled-coil domain-containing protein 8 n=1 Tax=Jaculus jaculus TaxID=51337 RepID=UPI001E1B22A9|nr:coiled-coil domain-containing protein 8 [Jaculus jaculus]XP_044989998.1 coiled-coil domain-containing protein 8 [Jaculus jaculus]XP_044989999.1 coiled-coil domain-containing protein 8 [Jaculus jaculus]
MLQIGEDVDYLLIPREVRLAGGVWRVISKPATKEAEFRERLTQFLEEEGRTLEDVARIIEKSTPHPPQPPKKPKEPRVRRVPQMVTPPPRLVVGTYDSSNASDSELSDLDAPRVQGNGRGPQSAKKVRRIPVSYLGSKFLGSELDSGDDDELVEAFLRRGDKKASAPPPRRKVNLPVPMFENSPGPQPSSKAERWRDYVSQVSWGKLRRRVKGWAPRSDSSGVGEARQASTGAERAASPRSTTSRGGDQGHVAGDASASEPCARRWRPKVKWASFRRRGRREEAVPPAQEEGLRAEEPPQVAENQRAEAQASQRAVAPAGRVAENQRAEVIAVQGAEAPADHVVGNNQRAVAPDEQRAEAAGNQRLEAPATQRARAPGDQGEVVGAQAVQQAAGSLSVPQAAPAARTRKQVKTVRFQTPGRFSWFRKRRRAFWHTPRLPTLPKRVPRAGEARTLRVLRAEARVEVEQEDQL